MCRKPTEILKMLMLFIITIIFSCDFGLQAPCFAGVKVYNDPHFTATTPSVPVYIISSENGENVVYSMYKSDEKGSVCIRAPCDGKIKIIAETEDEKALAAPKEKQNISPQFIYTVTEYREEIILDSEQIKIALLNTNGPMFRNDENCDEQNVKRQYFSFNFQGLSGKLTTNPSAEEYDFLTSWYPTFIQEACFVKIQIQTNLVSTGIIGKSYSEETGFWFGTFIAPLKGNRQGRRAACVEFRCPVYDSSNNKISTILTADISKVPGSTCSLISLSGELKTKSNINATDSSFNGTFIPDSNYGPNVGVYRDKKMNAQYSCYTGKNALESNYVMNPEVGIAITYKCT